MEDGPLAALLTGQERSFYRPSFYPEHSFTLSSTQRTDLTSLHQPDTTVQPPFPITSYMLHILYVPMGCWYDENLRIAQWSMSDLDCHDFVTPTPSGECPCQFPLVINTCMSKGLKYLMTEPATLREYYLATVSYFLEKLGAKCLRVLR